MTPEPISDETLAEIEDKHYQVIWQRCGADGVPDLTDPLPSFCGTCTDEEYVVAVEYGDTIDAAAGVVYWPCEPLTLAREVVRLRASLTAVEASAAKTDAILRDYMRIGPVDYFCALAAGSGVTP